MNSDPMTALAEALHERVSAFLFTFFVVFTLLYITLTAFQTVPNFVVSSDGEQADELVSATSSTEVFVSEEDVDTESVEVSNKAALPLTIVIDKYEREVEVLNPESRVVADLDAALLEGVVRHPDSATLLEDGTLFILGHSSYLPSVNNKNFQAFNGVQNLEWGDTIRVRSLDTEYKYQVERVHKARASELEVPIAGDKKRLVLATCNSFGSKDDRYIVEAILVSEKPM